MFDRRSLPPADLEFVVTGDTHYMLADVADVEFASRRQQTARAEAAIERINALDPDFVVHLGDLVQEYPGAGAYDRALTEALDQLDRVAAAVHHVAGNHDVGDKPDPTMPTERVTEESLARYHERVGPSWYAWEAGGCAFVVLNAQLMNAELPAAGEQRAWAEERLAAIEDGPAFLFLHLPPYLHAPDDPDLGHYDILAEPARSWLLDLVRDAPVTDVFSGHCHFEFLGRLGDTRFRVAPSLSFTRPGFAELFSSPPPPERGRDETAKLGFYLVRIVDGAPVVHRVRTRGVTGSGAAAGGDRLLTRPMAALAGSPLGVSLAYPLTEVVEVPETFPSAVRYPVDNAYPTLNCMDLGIGAVRLPVAELADDVSRPYLRSLRERGATVVGTQLGGALHELPRDSVLDELEVRLPAPWLDDADALDALSALAGPADRHVNLSAVESGRSVPGKQHGRLRSGFAVADLDRLDARLAAADLAVDRVTCRIRDGTDPRAEIVEADAPADSDRIGAVDWLVPLVNVSMDEAVTRIAKAVAAVATRADARLYLEPLRAMDRTMDPAPGLLDRRCNPTPAFTAAKCLNTVLFGTGGGWVEGEQVERGGVELVTLDRAGSTVGLALVEAGAGGATMELPVDRVAEWESAITLTDGTVRDLTRGDGSGSGRQGALDAPTLLTAADE